MNRYVFANGHVATGDRTLDAATITVEHGRISSITAAADATAVDLAGGWIMPGFIDTQVNGGGGILFNDHPDVDGIAAIAAAHRPFGTTALMPTLISDSPETIARAMDAVDEAIDAGIPGIVGIHIEGPVLNPARRGIHDDARLQALDNELLALLSRPRRGRVLVTLAPECTNPDRIAMLAKAGVRVSIGHSDATYDQARSAFAAGASGVTHLFNAMSPFLHRAPGVVGAALDDQAVFCGLIVDGFHVDDVALRIALRARRADRFMLVSDAMPCVGTRDKAFTLFGRPIRVEDGRCVAEDGTLAGSDLDMAAAVRNTVRRLGLDPALAAAMASTHPAAFLGLSHDRGTLASGRRADWVRLDAGLLPLETVIAGTTT